MEKIKYFCCICMKKDEQLCSLNNVANDNVKYLKKLQFCSPNVTWRTCYQICNSCICQLNASYAFLKTCLESELFRREELENKKEIESLDLEECTKETKYICDHCNKAFRQKKYLRQHITKLHLKKQSKRKCTPKTSEKTLESLGNSNAVKIELEPDSINEQSDLTTLESNIAETDNILKSESEAEGDVDNYSDESYSSELVLNEIEDAQPSKQKQLKRQPLQCTFCSQTFPKRQAWRIHIRTEHTSEKPFSCDQCDARYMNAYSLLIHKRKHNNEKPFVCSVCGKSFISSADLNHHNKTHNADRAYPCPSCDRCFKTHSNLRTHRLQMHLDPSEWKFLCDLCNKKFPIRGNLVKHLKRHAGIKEFDCTICGKKFIHNAELRMHFQTHTNQKPFKCKLCAKEYKNREGLRRHLKVVHGEGNWRPPKTDKRFLCPMCPKIFASSSKLLRHTYSHTGEKPYKCDYCQKGFIDSYGKKVHYKKYHNLELWT